MKPRRNQGKKHVSLCADTRDDDVTTQTADSKAKDTGDHHAEEDNELANRIFVGNISYRVSCDTVEDQPVVFSCFDVE